MCAANPKKGLAPIHRVQTSNDISGPPLCGMFQMVTATVSMVVELLTGTLIGGRVCVLTRDGVVVLPATTV